MSFLSPRSPSRSTSNAPPRSAVALLSPVLLGVVAGSALQLQQAALFESPLYAGMFATSMALLAAFVGLAFLRQRAGAMVSSALALLLACAAGFGLTGLRASAFAGAALNPALEGQDVLVTGQIAAMPQFGEDGVRFRLDVASALLAGRPVTLPPQLQLGWYAGFGVRPAKTSRPDDTEPQAPEFSLELQRQPQPLRAGENWQMTVRLKAPHGNSNPHGFDYELWLWEQGIQATGYVRTSAQEAPPKRLSATWAHPVERARQAVRSAIYARIENRQMAGVLAALVVGDQNAIERADWDVFRATGVAHLMSISGLHITMFAWGASLLIAWLWRRSVGLTPALCHALPAVSAGALGGLLLAILYSLFSGWGLPAQRTVWMLGTVVLLRLGGRQLPWHVVWLLAMAVVVGLDPWALMQAGFWLSFVAVGILFAASPAPGAQQKTGKFAAPSADHTDSRVAIILGAARARIYSALGRKDAEKSAKLTFLAVMLSKLAASLGAGARQQWVITLALTPLTLLLFNQVSLVGLLANALAIPWVTLVVTPDRKSVV